MVIQMTRLEMPNSYEVAAQDTKVMLFCRQLCDDISILLFHKSVNKIKIGIT